ncbi:hypothetical protein EDB83DRAFT_2380179 [Lactarius deliciosus]|nr:hypothetical protein EDB83DRAFT_2380179 [Lactarius deliciosus]
MDRSMFALRLFLHIVTIATFVRVRALKSLDLSHPLCISHDAARMISHCVRRHVYINRARCTRSFIQRLRDIRATDMETMQSLDESKNQ